MEKRSNKKVDVIIPTYYPDDKALQLVMRLLKQTYPVNRIYIINTDVGTFPAEFEQFGEQVVIYHIKPEQFDHGGTRNMGAMRSKADILVFLTQDAIPVNDHLLEELLQPFQDRKVGAAYGRQLPAADSKPIEQYTRSFNYPPESQVKSGEDLSVLGIKTYFCSNVCAAYRKDVYESLGGFETKTIFNEDMIMAAKIIQSGYKIAYAAEAKVIHSHNYGYLQQLKRNFDLAVSQAEHPEIFDEVKSEDEGIRLVKQTARYLIQIKKPWLVLSLVISSGFKYIGYRLGKRYRKLPAWVIKRCTMNQRYWTF